jgi:small-conductance mechanosensitive channel
MSVQIGDRVKVLDQDITGTVVEIGWGNKIVIEDDDSEYEWPDNRLEYRETEVEVIK